MSGVVELFAGDINDADADVLAIPIETSLAGQRRVAQAILARAGDAGQALLEYVREKHPGGLWPGSVVLSPPGIHPKAQRLAFVAVHNDRPGTPEDEIEADDARIEAGMRQLMANLGAGPQLTTLAMVPFAGVLMDASTSTRIAARVLAEHWREHPRSRLRRVVFVERTQIRLEDIAPAVLEYFPGAEVSV